MNKITIPDSFPNLPSSVKKIQKLFSSHEIDVPLLVNALKEEPLLSANILKLVNSPYYGLKGSVASIEHGVALLGVTVVRGIIMATVLKKSFPLDLSVYGISIEEFDKICILRTRFLKVWLKDENLDIQTLSSVAFLMESGKIITSNEIVKNQLSSDFLELWQKNSILEAEKEFFGSDSYEIASLLFEEWEFETSFVKLISNVQNPSTMEQKILHIICAAISVEGILEEKNITLAVELINEYGFEQEKFTQAVKTFTKETL